MRFVLAQGTHQTTKTNFVLLVKEKIVIGIAPFFYFTVFVCLPLQYCYSKTFHLHQPITITEYPLSFQNLQNLLLLQSHCWNLLLNIKTHRLPRAYSSLTLQFGLYIQAVPSLVLPFWFTQNTAFGTFNDKTTDNDGKRRNYVQR